MTKAITIGIAGGTGSGKTTLARTLKKSFEEDVVLLCMDWYYRSFHHLSYDERKLLNFDHPDAFDIDCFVEQLKQLKDMKPIQRPVYSFIEHRRLEECILAEPRHVIIVEGILLFENPDVRSLLDIKIYVDTDSDIRFARRLVRDIHERGRDIDSVVNQYLNTVKPMHEAFVEPTKRYADIIVPEGGMNEVATDMIVEKIKSILRNQDSTL
jgi:uridine kinase